MSLLSVDSLLPALAAAALASAFVVSRLTPSPDNALALAGWAIGLSALSAALSMLHPSLSGPVRKLASRLLRAVRRTS